MGEFVEFNNLEYEIAVFAGKRRRAISRELKLKQRWYRPEKRENYTDVVGAIAEYVAAKYLDVYFNPIGSYSNADMAGVVQVRAIPKENGYWRRLLVKPADENQYVLGIRVADDTDTGPYEVMGWSTLADMQPQWFHEDTEPPYDKPFYAVPNFALKPLEDLRSILLDLRNKNYLRIGKNE